MKLNGLSRVLAGAALSTLSFLAGCATTSSGEGIVIAKHHTQVQTYSIPSGNRTIGAIGLGLRITGEIINSIYLVEVWSYNSSSMKMENKLIPISKQMYESGALNKEVYFIKTNNLKDFNRARDQLREMR